MRKVLNNTTLSSRLPTPIASP